MLLGALAAAVALLPWRSLGPLGAVLGWFAGSALRIRRAQVQEAMRHAGIARPRAEARRMYRSLGRGVFELLWLAGSRRDRLEDLIAFDEASARRLEEARARGPIVIAASHTGNWELAAFRMASQGELSVVVKPIRAHALDAFCTRLRRAYGLSPSEPEGALLRSMAVLRRGGAVAMLIDQVPLAARHGIPAEFLGRTALVDRAPFALAERARASLVVAACRRAGAKYELRVLDVLPPPRDWAGVNEATLQATRALDAFVRENPSQWLWLHRRWKEPRTCPPCAAQLDPAS